MALPAALGAHVEYLRAIGHTIDVVEDGARYYIIIRGYPLPDGRFTPATTDLMVMADYQYPMSRLEMFWTDPTVHKVDGSLPRNADQFEAYAGRRWQRWSWHYAAWDPARHNLCTHLEVFCDRLARDE